MEQVSLQQGAKNLSSNKKGQTKYTELPDPMALVNPFLWVSPSWPSPGGQLFKWLKGRGRGSHGGQGQR